MATPPSSTPMVGQDGRIAPAWLAYFQQLSGADEVQVARGGSVVTINRTSVTGGGGSTPTFNAAYLVGGPIPAAVMPALTGDVTMPAGTVQTTIARIPLSTAQIVGTLPWENLPAGAGSWSASPTIVGPVTLATTLTVGGLATFQAPAAFASYLGHAGYVSQTTGWRITADGAADFRYLFTDELHARVFIADLEQALAGGQIITKSVALLAAPFTVPAAAGAATLHVRDLPSAPGMTVFESGDQMVLRSFSRASGSLTIGDAVGVVTAHADQGDGTQTWTWTRNAAPNAGSLSAATVIPVDSLALDFGVSGNGYYEVNAVDGAYGVNSPYAQIVTWATAPVAANRTVRGRFGKLTGITSVADEYGILAGTYAASNGQYFRASNQAFELHGIDLLLWDGSTNTVKLSRTGPAFALGSPVPTAYATGTGIWMGNDSGTYKFRVGDPSGNRLSWDGTNVVVGAGTVTINGTGIQVTPSGTGSYTDSASVRFATDFGMYGTTSAGQDQLGLRNVSFADNKTRSVAIDAGTGFSVPRTASILVRATAAVAEVLITGQVTASHAVTLSSTLAVTGAATLSSTLGVTGAVTLSSTLGVTGAVTLASTLGVSGTLTATGPIVALASTPVRIPNNTHYYARNAANSADVQLFGIDTSDRRHLTLGSVALVINSAATSGSAGAVAGYINCFVNGTERRIPFHAT